MRRRRKSFNSLSGTAGRRGSWQTKLDIDSAHYWRLGTIQQFSTLPYLSLSTFGVFQSKQCKFIYQEKRASLGFGQVISNSLGHTRRDVSVSLAQRDPRNEPILDI